MSSRHQADNSFSGGREPARFIYRGAPQSPLNLLPDFLKFNTSADPGLCLSLTLSGAQGEPQPFSPILSVATDRMGKKCGAGKLSGRWNLRAAVHKIVFSLSSLHGGLSNGYRDRR